jgi:hypothetical protein
MSDLRAILRSTWVWPRWAPSWSKSGIPATLVLLYAGLLYVSLSFFLSLSLSLFLSLALSLQQCMNLLQDLYLGIVVMIFTDGITYVLLEHILQKSIYI